MNDLHSAPEYAEVDGIKSHNAVGGSGGSAGASAYATTNLMAADGAAAAAAHYSGGSGSLEGSGRNRSISAAVSLSRFWVPGLAFADDLANKQEGNSLSRCGR